MVLRSHITDASMFKIWLEEKRGLAESSMYQYMQVINRFLITNPDLESIEDYNKFLIENTIKKRNTHYYSVIKGFIEWKIKDTNLRKRLLDALVKPRKYKDFKQERKYLNSDQILSLINNLQKQKHRVIALIQMLTGIRAGDVLRIAEGKIIPEVYNDKNVIKIVVLGKYNKRNVVYIHDELAQKVIMDYLTFADNIPGYYFLELGKMRNRGQDESNIYKLIKMNYTWYWEDVLTASKSIGLDDHDYATHDFRRCFARRAWDKYKDVNVLQRLLNHADPKVTLRYLEQSGLQNVDYHKEMQESI